MDESERLRAALAEAYDMADMLGGTVQAVKDRTLTPADRKHVIPVQVAQWRAWQDQRMRL